MKTEKNWRLLSQGAAILGLTAALAACGGSGGATSADSGAATSSSVAAATPVVSGTPATTVAADNHYTFRPTVTGSSSSQVTFSISNQPAWASFKTTTGELAGTPNAPAVGTYSSIVIAANDGTNTSTLPAFSIQVTPVGTASSSGGTTSGATAVASANGTMIPSATQIVDSSLNTWTVTSGVVYENGTAAGFTANVALVLYYGSTVYQETTACLWWSWSGSAWVSSSNPAASITPACSTSVASGGTSSSSGGTSSSSSSGGSGFGISVAGNKFISTQTGNVVQLLGVSVSGMEQGSTGFANGVENYGNATDPGFAAMASWNMNVVRIPLNEDTWLGVNNCVIDGGSSATLQSNIKQAVANANAAGMYVILDLHWTAPNAFGCPKGQGAMPDADNTVAFWTSVANTFKGNPAVIFEIFNEPFGNNVYANWVEAMNGAAPSGQSASDTSILVNGGTYYNGYMYQCNNGCNLTVGQEYLAPNTTSFQVAGYQAIINAIRATGATNVILANPIGWAGQIQTWLAARPTDPIGQLGVGWHEDGGSTADAQAVLNAGYPIVITEAYTIGDATFAWATANHVGFSYWAWVDWLGASGVLSNAKTHAAGSEGTSLKSSYCTQSSVNSQSGC